MAGAMLGAMLQMDRDSATPQGEGGAPIEPGADRAERLLAGLNEPQREAVVAGDGPLLVLAGAGSGKTRVLTHRIAYLLATQRARPGEILAITFTNKAASEMRERVAALVGRSVRAMWVTTFHSACARMLRADAETLGYARTFTIYDESDSLRMLKRCMTEHGVDPKRYPPRSIRAQISGAKNKLVDADSYEPAQGNRLRGSRRGPLPALREAHARSQRDGLRRPAGAHGQRAGDSQRRRASAGAAPSATSSSTSTRTPTTPSTGCCSCSPKSTAT